MEYRDSAIGRKDEDRPNSNTLETNFGGNASQVSVMSKNMVSSKRESTECRPTQSSDIESTRVPKWTSSSAASPSLDGTFPPSRWQKFYSREASSTKNRERKCDDSDILPAALLRSIPLDGTGHSDDWFNSFQEMADNAAKAGLILEEERYGVSAKYLMQGYGSAINMEESVISTCWFDEDMEFLNGSEADQRVGGDNRQCDRLMHSRKSAFPAFDDDIGLHKKERVTQYSNISEAHFLLSPHYHSVGK